MTNIGELQTGERVQLRRAAGQRLGEANGTAMGAFYKALPPGPELYPSDADAWFAAGCLQCLWDAPGKGESLPLILSKMSRAEDAADKYERRLASLFDTAWSEDGYLLRKISRLVKQMRQAGYRVDCSRLLQDLIRWNYTDQPVQKCWAGEFYGTTKTDNDTKMEAENAD